MLGRLTGFLTPSVVRQFFTNRKGEERRPSERPIDTIDISDDYEDALEDERDEHEVNSHHIQTRSSARVGGGISSNAETPIYPTKGKLNGFSRSGRADISSEDPLAGISGFRSPEIRHHSTPRGVGNDEAMEVGEDFGAAGPSTRLQLDDDSFHAVPAATRKFSHRSIKIFSQFFLKTFKRILKIEKFSYKYFF